MNPPAEVHVKELFPLDGFLEDGEVPDDLAQATYETLGCGIGGASAYAICRR